jgi:hypothetical protein
MDLAVDVVNQQLAGLRVREGGGQANLDAGRNLQGATAGAEGVSVRQASDRPVIQRAERAKEGISKANLYARCNLRAALGSS